MSFINSIFVVDNQTTNFILNIRNSILDCFFSYFTILGHWITVTLIVIIISMLLYFYQRKNLILPFIVSVIGSGITTLIIKFIVNRARPSSEVALYTEKLSSFPSAHAALIFALFAFLIYVLWQYFSNLNSAVKITLSLIFSLIILLVGFSRIYLGVHFVSDVAVGYLVGLLWLLIGIYFPYRKNLI